MTSHNYLICIHVVLNIQRVWKSVCLKGHYVVLAKQLKLRILILQC